MPEMSVTSPGMSTHRSRGIDRMVTVLAAGSMRTAMVTSLRWPPASASDPNALTWVALSTKARESEPTSNKVRGLLVADRCRADQVLGVDLLDLVEAVVGVEVEAPGPDRGQHDDDGERIQGAPPPAVLASLLLFPRLAQIFLQVGTRPGVVLPVVGRPGQFGLVGSQGSESTWPGRPVPFTGAIRTSRRARAAPRFRPPARAGKGQTTGAGHRQGRDLPDRHLRGVPRRRPAGIVHPGRVRRVGRRHPRTGAGH